MTYPKTAIISDLHGNVPALETAYKDALERGVERFVCLGDVVGYGAEPRPCLDLVMRTCVEDAKHPFLDESIKPGICLKGNHEEALLESPVDFNPKARAAIEWTKKEIGNCERERKFAYWDFLGELKATDCDEVAQFAHGSPRRPVHEYIVPRDSIDTEKMQANFAVMQRDVCFIGHSHVPAIYYDDGRLFRPSGTEGPYELATPTSERAIVNVGSVGQPRDGDTRLSYAIFDGRCITFIRLEYENDVAAERIRAVPELPAFLADRLGVGR